VIPARMPHRYYADSRRPWSIWWLHVTGDDVADLLSATGTTPTAPTMPLSDLVAVTELIDTGFNPDRPGVAIQVPKFLKAAVGLSEPNFLIPGADLNGARGRSPWRLTAAR
jgi:hypothetical protein